MQSALISLNEGTLGVLGDVRNLSEIQNFISQVKLKLDPIDAVITNEGEGIERDLDKVDEEFF